MQATVLYGERDIRFEDRPDPTIVEPSRLLAERSAEVCGQCHGITVMKDEHREFENTHGNGFEPGGRTAYASAWITIFSFGR